MKMVTSLRCTQPTGLGPCASQLVTRQKTGRTGFFGEIRWTSTSSTREPGMLLQLYLASQVYLRSVVALSNTGILLCVFFSLNPVVSFPFNRGPYPRYEQGVELETAIDDSADARAMAKDFLVYIGAFAEEELDVYEVTFTEGAESGMTHIWAGKVCFYCLSSVALFSFIIKKS